MRDRHRRRLRRAVAERVGAIEGVDGYAECAYCGIGVIVVWEAGSEPVFLSDVWTGTSFEQMAEVAHLDHVIPESRNGPTSLDNTVIACSPCNLAKRDRALGDPVFQSYAIARRQLVGARVAEMFA